MKRCTKCGIEKSLSEYNKKGLQGYREQCKPCWNARRAELRKKKKYIEYKKAWKADNPEKVERYKKQTQLNQKKPVLKECSKCKQIKLIRKKNRWCEDCKSMQITINNKAFLHRIMEKLYRECPTNNTKQCKECGDLYIAKGVGHLYCSKTCANKSKKRTYYATPKGKAIRRAGSIIRHNRKRANGKGKSYYSWLKDLKRKRYFNCYWCGDKTPIHRLQVDHVIPISKGGIDGLSNVCASCDECNNKKSNKGLKEWTKELTGQMVLNI